MDVCTIESIIYDSTASQLGGVFQYVLGVRAAHAITLVPKMPMTHVNSPIETCLPIFPEIGGGRFRMIIVIYVQGNYGYSVFIGNII